MGERGRGLTCKFLFLEFADSIDLLRKVCKSASGAEGGRISNTSQGLSRSQYFSAVVMVKLRASRVERIVPTPVGEGRVESAN